MFPLVILCTHNCSSANGVTTQGKDVRELKGKTLSSQSLPEDIMVAVDLLPFPGALQYPAVADNRAARALRAVAALLPVVQHLAAGGGVEGGQSLGQG